MKNLRYRPKGDFSWEADWQQLYILTEHWESDLSFYSDDLKFLEQLIDKYFIFIAQKENRDKVLKITHGLTETRTNCQLLLEKTRKHLSHLAHLIDDPYKYDSHVFRNEHQKIEDDIAAFVKKFRTNRKNIFTITENIVKREKLEHLLTA